MQRSSLLASREIAAFRYGSFAMTVKKHSVVYLAFTKDNLKRLAVELRLDSQAFDQCLDSGKYAELVQQQNNIARQIGVQSTPSFLINGQAIIGAQTFESFQQVIEQQLSQSGQ